MARQSVTMLIENQLVEPDIIFRPWKHWRKRETTYDPFHDVPRDMYEPGIYLLAQLNDATKLSNTDSANLYMNPQVVYLGASTMVTNRLEGKKHSAVYGKYAEKCDDPEFKKLFFSICHLNFKNLSAKGNLRKVNNAYLYYIERKLIWDFAKEYKRLPLLNQQ